MPFAGPEPRAALIVAHGSPAEPEPQEAALAALAAAVAARAPGWRVEGATLAAEGALDAAVARTGPTPVVYPFFMAAGWFTGIALPRRLAAAGAATARRLPPLGAEPALPALVARLARAGAAKAGIAPERATLLLAAHGSKIARRSADTTHAMAAAVAARIPFARVRVGFVEERPFLADAARRLGPAVCLPFFALRAGHVAGDVPEALAEAGFEGPLLPAVGEAPEIPGLIAAALARAATAPVARVV